ncbi:MAG TPA: TonB family protein [Bryobacteraceae bacterium]|jgi:TonB family protein|nr:TonB family protein [Bryobacteraceae bacterium]
MPYADAFEEREPLGKPVLASLALHAGVVAVLISGSFLKLGTTERWGDKESMGGSVAVSAVSKIPMVARSGTVNPVANDTESQVPQAPPKPKAVPKEKAPAPDAIPLKSRSSPKKKYSETSASTQRYSAAEPRSNQVYSSSGASMVSPMMGLPGSGGVGIGKGTPLGDRFGAYAALLQQLVARNWKTQDIDSRLRTAPPVIMNFTILKDGTIRDIRVKTGSGNVALDRSAERALYDVGKVPPLPAGYERDKAEIEFWFELKR